MQKNDLVKVLTVLGIIGILAIVQVVDMFMTQYPIMNWPPRGSTIVAFGDSLTEGVGASSPLHGYVGVLADRLHAPIVNKGVAGNTSAQALARIDEVTLLSPDIVILFLGGNDLLQKVETKETLEHMRSIIARLHKDGATVILIGFKGFIGEGLNSVYEDLAQETGCLFVSDVLGGVLGSPSLMSDEVHPNDAGYLKVADKIAPTLEGALYTAADAHTQGTSTTRTSPDSE